MSEIAVRVEGLSKRYRIGERVKYKSLRDSLTKAVSAPFRKLARDSKSDNFIWALKDVFFEVKQGEVVGIIGRNGAGKSTLLKILSRIVEPTEGYAEIHGRVGSLLEVGTGFHPELTGRENIYLNGAILGMTKKEIERKFDEIVAFAEIEKFIDTPVKHYSSGMYVRLAFAVAAHLEPEILLVDEVLAVGDAAFQKKCLGRMGDVSKKEGRTVLFVSHNMAAVQNICNKGIFLSDGRVIHSGAVVDTVKLYIKMMTDHSAAAGNKAPMKAMPAYMEKAYIDTGDNHGVQAIPIYQGFQVVIDFVIKDEIEGIPVPNLHFKTADGTYAFVTSFPGMKHLNPGKYRVYCKIPGNLLNDGVYSIGIALTEHNRNGYEVLFHNEGFLTLSIIDTVYNNPFRYSYAGPVPGVVRPLLEWDIKPLEL